MVIQQVLIKIEKDNISLENCDKKAWILGIKRVIVIHEINSVGKTIEKM